MSTREESGAVDRGDVPKGYVVRYHELRGYDSPDKWWSASTKRGRSLGNHSFYAQARDACVLDAKKLRKRKKNARNR